MKWRKPNGTEIETNDREATIAAASALGWERVKRKRRTKAEMDAARAPESVQSEAESVESEPDVVESDNESVE